MVDNEKKVMKCLIVTVSDTRTIETDESGLLIKNYMEEAGYPCSEHLIIKKDQAAIEEQLFRGVNNLKVDVILMTGGTGIAKRDVTIEVVERHLEKSIPAFGEIFRSLSYQNGISSYAFLSRATAGVKGRTAIFALPGLPAAVQLAMEKLVIPELPHVISEIHK